MRIKPFLEFCFLVKVARYMTLRTHHERPAEVMKKLRVSKDGWRERLGLPKKRGKFNV